MKYSPEEAAEKNGRVTNIAHTRYQVVNVNPKYDHNSFNSNQLVYVLTITSNQLTNTNNSGCKR